MASVFGDSGISRAQVGAMMHGGYGSTAGEVAATALLNGASAAGAATADLLYLYPFRWYGGRAISSLFGRVTTIGTASNIKMGVWAHSRVTGRPTGLPVLANNAGIPTTSTGIKKPAVGPLDPSPGIYWIGSVQDGTTAGMQAINAANFEAAALVPVIADFNLLRGAANNGWHGVSTPLAYAADITTASLTGATFTDVGGNASIIPIIELGF